MGIAYENLDEATRRFMVEEIDMDVASGKIYISNYLNADGCERWPVMLREAAQTGTDDSLGNAIRTDNCLKRQVERRKPKGGYTMAAVPITAHQTMGEGEFGRYYARGLCRRAIDEGIPQLEVYRAKAVMEPRPASEAKIGMRVDPVAIFANLRETQGVEPALGLPPGPNSGLTLRIPRA
ncbi:hypothetical protein [Sphingomonas melonis]|uniref:Uncharacterized protein n=1 Tax=Sphingomonas melonis TaxID=152682 RepID=A0A7Y9K323_9SPHN|nr:hypothetical protein [Sphingomonas melonis]NYD91641.1 hypothetical protein [Sphingomonas melonis]